MGGNSAGEHIFQRATLTGKRVQANLGAKNHATVMPDADREQTVNAIVGAAFGAAGQRWVINGGKSWSVSFSSLTILYIKYIGRCMALSTVIFVGESKEWLADIVEKAKKLTVGCGFDAKTDVGQCHINKKLKHHHSDH